MRLISNKLISCHRSIEFYDCKQAAIGNIKADNDTTLAKHILLIEYQSAKGKSHSRTCFWIHFDGHREGEHTKKSEANAFCTQRNISLSLGLSIFKGEKSKKFPLICDIFCAGVFAQLEMHGMACADCLRQESRGRRKKERNVVFCHPFSCRGRVHWT